MDKKILQQEYAAYKASYPVKIKEIIKNYEPVFDKYIALHYAKTNIPPPVCNSCGQRVTVAYKQVTTCKACTDNAMKYTYEKFINEFAEYIKSINCSVSQWEGLKSKGEQIQVSCNIHDTSASQQMKSFISGRNPCRRCVAESYATKIKWPKSKWLAKAETVHSKFYDYSKAADVHDHNSKITIICPLHDEFEQMLYLHLNGHGCYHCGVETNQKLRSYTTESFVAAAKEVHNNKYDYTKTMYTAIRDKVIITCPLHGDFQQVAYYHTAGNGCPACGRMILNPGAVSKPEAEIYNFVRSLVADAEQSNRSVLNFNSELDVYVPSKKFAVELDGLYWHASKGKETDYRKSKQHLSKTENCISNGITLLHIFDNEWKQAKDICKSMICQKLGMSDKIYARKCVIKDVSSQDARVFFNATHLQGFTGAASYIGLYHNNELVAAMSFGKSRYSKTDFELLRFSSKLNTTVVGGFSKLLKHFCRLNPNKTIVSYANRRWSEGNVYLKNGFTLSHMSAPCYYYTKDYNTLLHRSNFMKSTLKDKLEVFDPKLSEVENMYANKYGRVWDCGNYVFTLNT